MHLKPGKSSLPPIHKLPVPSAICFLTVAILLAYSIQSLIWYVLYIAEYWIERMTGESVNVVIGSSWVGQILSNLLGLLAAFFLYRLGLWFATATESYSEPKEAKSSAVQASVEEGEPLPSEQLSLLREIRDSLKEPQHHE